MKKLVTILALAIGTLSASSFAAGPVGPGASTGGSPAGPAAAAPGLSIPRTAMLRHMAYFDANKDGTITPREMVQKGRDLGMTGAGPVLFAGGTAFARGLLPNLRNPNLPLAKRFSASIYLSQATRSMLAGNSGTFDKNGVATAESVEALAARGNALVAAAKGVPGAPGTLTSEGAKLITGQDTKWGPQRFAASTAWNTIFKLNGGPLTHKDLMAFYSVNPNDPTLFAEIEARVAAAKSAGK